MQFFRHSGRLSSQVQICARTRNHGEVQIGKIFKVPKRILSVPKRTLNGKNFQSAHMGRYQQKHRKMRMIRNEHIIYV